MQSEVKMLTGDELTRYDRQMLLKGIGRKGQGKLKKARAFIAGVGGLGCPAAMYLAVAGLGALRLVDNDTVELSNLNRQVLHSEEDIGRCKVDSAAEKLKKLNKHVHIEPLAETITEENVCQLIDGCDVIVDALDNLPTRYILNKAAIDKRIPFFHGAVYGFEGRALTVIPGRSACLWCVYRGRVTEGKFPVIGVAPALIGCLQATEVVKYLTGVGELLTDTLFIYDGLNLEFIKVTVQRDPECQHCGHVK